MADGRAKSSESSDAGDGRRVHADPFPEGFWRAVPRRFNLSARETDVLRLLARGYTDRGIATTLDVAAPTVRSHARAVYHKMECLDRVDLILTLFELSADGRAVIPGDESARNDAAKGRQ